MSGSLHGGSIMAYMIRWIRAIILAFLWRPSKSGLENFLNGTTESTAYQTWILRGMTTKPRFSTTWLHLLGKWGSNQRSWRPWLKNKSGGGGNYVATAAQSWAVLFVLLWFMRPLGGLFIPAPVPGGLGALAPSGAVVASPVVVGEMVAGVAFPSPVGAPVLLSPTPRPTGQLLQGSVISTSTRAYFGGLSGGTGGGGSAGGGGTGGGGGLVGSIISTFTPYPTYTHYPTNTHVPTLTPTYTPTYTPSFTVSPTVTDTPTITPTVCVTGYETFTPTPDFTETPDISASPTSTPDSGVIVACASDTPVPSATAIPTDTAVPSVTASMTVTVVLYP